MCSVDVHVAGKALAKLHLEATALMENPTATVSDQVTLTLTSSSRRFDSPKEVEPWLVVVVGSTRPGKAWDKAVAPWPTVHRISDRLEFGIAAVFHNFDLYTP